VCVCVCVVCVGVFLIGQDFVLNTPPDFLVTVILIHQHIERRCTICSNNTSYSEGQRFRYLLFEMRLTVLLILSLPMPA
jgi:hypothetical protein